MKFLIALLALVSLAPAQIVVSNGVITGPGEILSTTPGGTAAFPDSTLLNWDTSLENTPTAGPNVCVGTLFNVAALMGGCATTFNSGNPATDLQNALNGAACGQRIILKNTTYTGNFTLPNNRFCTSSNWVIVERDITDPVFPAQHTRVDPCYMGIPQNQMPYYPYPLADTSPNSCAQHMPRIVSNLTTGNSGFSFNPNVNTKSIAYWRFIGLEITRNQSFDLALVLVDLDFQPLPDCALVGSGASALPASAGLCQADQPNHIIFDRCVIHGDAQRQTVIGVKMAGTRWIAIIDSYGYDVGVTFAGGAGDGHWYGWGTGHGYTGVGFGKFSNNFTASSTMASEFCGAFCEPTSPVTGADGVPTNIWFTQDWMWKNPYWDSQIGQAASETISIEGRNYGPAPAQELTVSPTAIELQAGQTFQFQTTWLNDSRGGLNRMGNAGTSCTSGGNTVCVDGVLNGNSILGIITKNGEHNVLTGAWVSQNQITFTYTVCTGVGTPIAGCNGVTTPGTHTIVFKTATVDGKLATLGNNLNLSATATVTVVSAAPANQIALSPSAPDLSLQPSYSDASGNVRLFCLPMFAFSNFSSASLTWKVDGIQNGNASAGHMYSTASAPGSNPGANDSTAAYCSGTGLGVHSISVTSAAGTTVSQAINVSTSAPILGYDLKPYTSKNGWELKCGKRILLQNSLLEVGWGSAGNGGGQDGTNLLLQTGNQASQVLDGSGNNVGYGPEVISDINIDHVWFSHFAFGFVNASLNAALGQHRVSMTHIVSDDTNYQRWSHGFLKASDTIQFSGSPATKLLLWTSPAFPLIDNISMRHITYVGKVTSLASITNDIVQFPAGPFTIQDSILASNGSQTFSNNFGDVNDCNQSTGTGSSNTEALTFLGTGWNTQALSSCRTPKTGSTFYCNVTAVGWELSTNGAAYAPTTAPPGPTCTSSYSFHHLALLDSTAAPSVFTSSNIWQPATTDAALFRNFNNDVNPDLRVVAGGLYDAGGARQASDGLALGADVAAVNTAVATAKCGATVCATTIDLLDWVLMPLPNRASFHMHGVGSDTYSVLDTDALYPAGYPSGTFFWDKHSTGNPWDIEKYNSTTYSAEHWITEDGDTVDQQTCINNGFPNGCWGDPNAYKRFPNPVPIMPRFFASGSTVTIDSPGPNTFVRTTNCELPGTSTNVNLGDVSAVTTGPFNMTWAGSIDSGTGVVGLSGPTIDNVNGVPTMRNDYYYGGPLSTRNFNDKESTFYVLGFGRVAWFFYKKVSGTYVEQQHTINNITTSGQVAPNFPCGAGHSWWN